MKKVIGTMLFTTAVCGMLSAQPAHAMFWPFKTHHVQNERNVTTTSTVTRTYLSRSDIVQLQSSLASKGFYRGRVDGIWGPMTRSAVASFQSSQGVASNGLPTSDTLAMLGVSATNTSYVSPQNIEPAAGGEGGLTLETTTTTNTSYGTRATGGFVAIDTNHVNGSTCLLCTNGIIGNGGTPSMRSNEY